jgi:hypothetical protein
MSHFREIVIVCDERGCGVAHETGQSTVEHARRDAHLDGWATIGIDDYCPEHKNRRA